MELLQRCIKESLVTEIKKPLTELLKALNLCKSDYQGGYLISTLDIVTIFGECIGAGFVSGCYINLNLNSLSFTV